LRGCRNRRSSPSHDHPTSQTPLPTSPRQPLRPADPPRGEARRCVAHGALCVAIDKACSLSLVVCGFLTSSRQKKPIGSIAPRETSLPWGRVGEGVVAANEATAHRSNHDRPASRSPHPAFQQTTPLRRLRRRLPQGGGFKVGHRTKRSAYHALGSGSPAFAGQVRFAQALACLAGMTDCSPRNNPPSPWGGSGWRLWVMHSQKQVAYTWPAYTPPPAPGFAQGEAKTRA